MKKLNLNFYKISVYSANFKCHEYRYGINKDDVVKRLKEEYLRYEDKRAYFEMEAEEIKYNRVKVNVNLNFRE